MFFIATGSMANIGGAATAPVVAGIYHPAMAPVGLLMNFRHLLETQGLGMGLFEEQYASGVSRASEDGDDRGCEHH